MTIDTIFNAPVLNILAVLDQDEAIPELEDLLASACVDAMVQAVDNFEYLDNALSLDWDLVITGDGLRTRATLKALEKYQVETPVISVYRGHSTFRNNTLEGVAAFVDADDQVTLLATIADVLKNASPTHRSKDQYALTGPVATTLDYDPLTKLPVRVSFIEQVDEILRVAHRNKLEVGMIALKLDRFKVINERFGSRTGDLVLKEVAARLESCLFGGDVFARVGSHKFAVALQAIFKKSDVESIAQRIFSVFRKPVEVGDQKILLSPNVGYLLSHPEDVDAETLLLNAEAASLAARDRGGVRPCCFRTEMQQERERASAIEYDLQHALGRREFELYYQPKNDAKTGRVVGAEALLRWNHAEKGLIGPDEFIPILEHSGQVVRVGEWTLHAACCQWQHWRSQGVVGGDAQISVNISSVQFKAGNLEETVANALRDSELPGTCLDLEITESLLMHDIESVCETLNNLKAMGCSISIDDFGTGYSSLAYLKKFPIDYLKIDKSFIGDVMNDVDDASIASAIIDLAHNLRMEVIAEGVEDKNTLTFLVNKGCDYYQGYYASRPLPASAFRGHQARVTGNVVRLA
ncbi:MAG: bifunctional diguanylate cyclase/phosphodiesterase [Cellvibrionaceae bacterium]